MGVLGQIVAGVALVVGLMQCCVGFFSIIENWKADYCSTIQTLSGFSTDNVACVGPLLGWNQGDSGFTKDINGPPTQNGDPQNWRGFFTFLPDEFLDVWTPVVFGLLSVSLHFGHTRWDAISSNWLIFCGYLIIQALFASIGYSGNLGVITGFLGFFAAALCIIAAWLDPTADRCLDLHECIPCLKGVAVSPRAKPDEEA